VPVILILSHSFGLFGIEISQSLADILSAAVTIPFFLSFFRTLPKEDEELQMDVPVFSRHVGNNVDSVQKI